MQLPYHDGGATGLGSHIYLYLSLSLQHLTIILTGYKKDIEEKLLSVDPGL